VGNWSLLTIGASVERRGCALGTARKPQDEVSEMAAGTAAVYCMDKRSCYIEVSKGALDLGISLGSCQLPEPDPQEAQS
jgi:hypothetical protein